MIANAAIEISGDMQWAVPLDEINQAVIRRLPVIQPREVANDSFPFWRMRTPCRVEM